MSDSRPICPNCNSKQTRYTPSKSDIGMARFNCKNCGQGFIIATEVQRNKKGCLGSILKVVILTFIFVIGISIFLAITKNKSGESEIIEHPDENSSFEQTHIDDVEDAVEIERSEQAAHAYIPTEDDYKQFEEHQKVQKTENLTIVETTRETE